MPAEEWTKKYFQALEAVKESIGLCHMFITGLNTNIDGLRHVEGEEIEGVIAKRHLEKELVMEKNGLFGILKSPG
jgi:ADP-dependent phosphofructokinase/glucokinase